MTLQDKITKYFDGKVVRKDLAKGIKGNAVVPMYVLEYLLGQHCASFDDEVISQGVEKVKEIVKNHFVHRDEAEVIKSIIREKGQHKVIDKVTVKLNEKSDSYEAEFSNLGIKRIQVDDDTIKKHPKLLTGGVWCIIELGYLHSEERGSVPWILVNLKPIQVSNINIDEYKELRQFFTKEEWVDLLMQSIGLNPETFTFRGKLIQLTRLVSFCENNFNLIELGPKGTGKSHIFSELSPHGILISGGDVTQAKLFVNNATGNIGLVGYWDCIAFDEFAGKEKRVDRKLVDIMKNFMANKSFSRGRDIYGATASMAFVGNTQHSVPYMLKHSDLFDALPKGYYDTAFLDRVHQYIPGWEVQKLNYEMFTNAYGFIVDYLAEALKELRKGDYSHLIKKYYSFSDTLTSRDRDGITKTFSGLAKIIFPDEKCSKEEIKELLEFAIEGRKRVKNQLIKIDDTFEVVSFDYTDIDSGHTYQVETLENIENNFSYKPHRVEEITKNGSRDEIPIKEIITQGEGHRIEFKSTLRYNIFAKNNDKEITFAVLKTIAAFLNTDGGTLLIGVSDDGKTLGIETDKFQNSDKFLIHLYNHLKSAFNQIIASSIKTKIHSTDDGTICEVTCPKSTEPVYLKFDGKEDFFIRSGPTTERLSISQIQKYISHHF